MLFFAKNLSRKGQQFNRWIILIGIWMESGFLWTQFSQELLPIPSGFGRYLRQENRDPDISLNEIFKGTEVTKTQFFDSLKKATKIKKLSKDSWFTQITDSIFKRARE